MLYEKIEWTQYRREDANDPSKKRILLIGDSITNGIREDVYSLLPQGYTQTAIATSKGVNDPCFLPEIDLFCSQDEFRYETVYFNNGLHIHGQSEQEYEENLSAALAHLKEKIPGAKFVIGLSTPILIREVSAETHETPITLAQKNDNKNLARKALVPRFNLIAERVAKEFGYPVFDPYTLVVDRPELKVADGVHFTPEGKKLIATALMPYLL